MVGSYGVPGRAPRSRRWIEFAVCSYERPKKNWALISLQCGTQLGELTDVNTGWRADRPEMLVTPFVFQVRWSRLMTPNHEVAEVVWVPLDFLMQPDKREPMQWEWKGKTLETDSYLYASYRIWGLSLMMIDEMLMLWRDGA